VYYRIVPEQLAALREALAGPSDAARPRAAAAK
jgi:hypothetical protein